MKYGRYAAKKYPAVRKRYRVYAPAVKQLASDVMYLKGLINSEPHFFTTSNAINVDYNGNVFDFCLIPQGDTVSSRTGNRILPRWFALHMSWGCGNIITVPKVIMRCIVFRWYADSHLSANTPTPSEILSVTGTLQAPLSFLNPDITGPKGDRIRAIEVLHNEMVTFSPNSNHSQTINLNIDLNPKSKSKKEHIEYDDGATASPSAGGLYMLVISDQAVSTETGIQVHGKLTFYDN